jgi:hypothetical protein
VLRFDQPSSTTLHTFLAFQWTPSGLSALCWTYGTGNTTAVPSGGARKIVPLLDNLLNTTPNSIRPLRMAIRMRNYSVFTSTAGQVKVLGIPGPIEWSFKTTGTDLLPSDTLGGEVEAMINGHPNTRTFTATDFLHSKSFVLSPSSHGGYHEWGEFIPLLSSTPWPGSQDALTQGADRCPMYTLLVMLVFTPTTANNYSFTIHRQDACRYPANSVQATFARIQPTGEPALIHDLHQIAGQNAGLTLEAAAAGAAGAVGLPGLGNMARRAVGRMGARVAPVLEGMVERAAGVIGAAEAPEMALPLLGAL